MLRRRPRLETSALSLVWPEDEAIDVKESDLERYESTLDMSALVFDGRPTVFHCTIPGGAEQHACTRDALDATTGRAFGIELADRVFFRCTSTIGPVEFDDGQLGDLPKDEWIEVVPAEARMWIGTALMLRARAPESGSTVPLPSAPRSSGAGGSSHEQG